MPESSPDQKRQIVPAPAPKENAWTQRRKQVEVSVVTGIQTTISDSIVERKESLSRPPLPDEQSPSRRNKSSTTPPARKVKASKNFILRIIFRKFVGFCWKREAVER